MVNFGIGELRNGAVLTDDSHDGQALDLTDGGNQHMHVANAAALNIAALMIRIAFGLAR